MALEPITRQEQIIAGKDLEPITRMEKFLKQYGGGGGSGFEYDFIIKTTDGVSYTLETGTYDSINSKLGNQPIKGKIIANVDEGSIRIDTDCIHVIYNNETLTVSAYSGNGVYTSLIINQDNTVTVVE